MTVLRQLLMGGAHKLPQYLGQIASPSTLFTNYSASFNQAMTRTRQTCFADVSGGVQLAFANWQNIEGVVGAAATITASIEYPVGTFTQARFSGAVTGAIPDGGYVISDPIAVNIPKGATFYVRSYFTCTAGFPHNAGLFDPNDGTGQACTFAISGVVDQTMGGTVVNTSSSIGFPVVAIIAPTTTPSFVILGDSRAAGFFDSGSGARGEIARSLDGLVPWMNLGISASTAANASTSKRVQLAQFCSHVITQFGINDLDSANTATQVITNVQAIRAALPGKRFFGCTVAPHSTSTDAFATTVNQTPAASNAQRIAYNSLVRATPLGFTGFIEIADQVESARDSGVWKAPGFTGDGLHESPTGYAAIFTSGAINAKALASQ